MGYFYILGTIFFTVFGQILLKWKISKYGELPSDIHQKMFFLLKLLVDPAIIIGLLSAFIASFFWMAAMTKFDISFAYPFMSISFVLVYIISVILFNEPFTFTKGFGLLIVIIGLIISSRSA